MKAATIITGNVKKAAVIIAGKQFKV